jgi:hypothetical protein
MPDDIVVVSSQSEPVPVPPDFKVRRRHGFAAPVNTETRRTTASIAREIVKVFHDTYNVIRKFSTTYQQLRTVPFGSDEVNKETVDAWVALRREKVKKRPANHASPFCKVWIRAERDMVSDWCIEASRRGLTLDGLFEDLWKNRAQTNLGVSNSASSATPTASSTESPSPVPSAPPALPVPPVVRSPF